MRSVQQGLKDEGYAVPMTKLCRWFEVARRTTYYKPTRSPAKVKPELAEPIKEMIEAEPSFGYRTVAALLGMNKNTVQRIFRVKGWQVRKRALGQRPRMGSTPISRTVLKELQPSDPAWRPFAAFLGYGVARCSQTHPLVLHPVSDSSFDRLARA